MNRKHSLDLKDYHDLHRYSVENYEFWIDLWEFLGLIASVSPNPKQILAKGQLADVPIWFPTVRMNYAENILRRRDDAVACTVVRESSSAIPYTFKQLRGEVEKLAAALRCNGLEAGDRVAGIVTNSVTAIVIALAATSIGAIYSGTATDMGSKGILDRYRQIKPKFVFAETEVSYSGKTVDLIPKVSEVIVELLKQGLQRAILLPSVTTGRETTATAIPRSVHYSQFIATGDSRPLEFAQLPFSHPLFILYSSGTTGAPKCIVHSAGGVLLQTSKDIAIGLDVTPDDTLLQYTTTGWMMWSWMLSALSIGARLVLYDGSPFYPSPEHFLKMVDQQGVSVLGTSPRFLSDVQGRRIDPLKIGSFQALRILACTGAVLTAPVFSWAQTAFGERIHVISSSGGTDICAAFISGAACLPVHVGELQAKGLGMKVEVFDQDGNNIESTGEPGELVCSRPHPSLPLKFWGDESGQRLREAYFGVYPGIWRQGDFMVVNPQTKGILVLGRSDGVLNPSGVRFGSGEIYAVLENHFGGIIDDSLCIGQRRAQDSNERVLLFLKMRAGQRMTPAFVEDVNEAIKKELSRRHVPAHVFEVPEIPYTVNGKKIEIAVKQIVSGSSHVKPSGTVANPDSLQFYYQFRDLEGLVGNSKARL